MSKFKKGDRVVRSNYLIGTSMVQFNKTDVATVVKIDNGDVSALVDRTGKVWIVNQKSIRYLTKLEKALT